MAIDCNDDKLLLGAAMISERLFGTNKRERHVYRLVETTDIPIFRMGKLLAARPRKLDTWIANQEARASQKREVA